MSNEPLLPTHVPPPPRDNENEDPLAVYNSLIADGRFGLAIIEYFCVRGVPLGVGDVTLLTDRYYGLPNEEIMELAHLSHITLRDAHHVEMRPFRVTPLPFSLGVESVEENFAHIKYLIKRKLFLDAAHSVSSYLALTGFVAGGVFAIHWLLGFGKR